MVNRETISTMHFKVLFFVTLVGLGLTDEQAKICQSEECKQTASAITNSIDKSVNPCDNFYQYSCGTWIKNHPVKDDSDQIGESNYAKLQFDLLDELIKLLNETSIQKDNKYLHPLINFYHGCMDTEKREANKPRDLKAIKDLLNRSGGWPMIDDEWTEDQFDVETAIIESLKIRFTSPFLNIHVIRDFKNTSRPMIVMTDEFYPMYGDLIRAFPGPFPTKHDDKIRMSKNKYQLYMSETEKITIEKVAEALRASPLNKTLFEKDVTEQERAHISSGFWGFDNINYVKEEYDHDKITVKELANFKGLNFTKILYEVMKSENISLNANDEIFVQRDYLNDLGGLNRYTKRQIANNMAIDLVMKLVEYTSTELADYSVWWSGAAPKDLGTTCVAQALINLPELLARLYYDKSFEKDAIEDMNQLISALKQSLHLTLEQNSWMDDQSKEKAINKLEHIAQSVAFPEGVLNLTKLEANHKQYENFSQDNLLSDALKIFAHKKTENFKELKNPENAASHWKMPVNAVIVNAFYNPMANGIYFPAGIANLPFYSHTRPRSVNLAQIGMVIAHELTHAFDNTGKQFDEFGNLQEWLTSNTSEAFTDKAKCFIEQYNKFTYDIGGGKNQSINGMITQGENIADNGAIRIAYKAMEIYKSKSNVTIDRLPGLNDYSDEKLFFASFATLWCASRGKKGTYYALTDVHSPEDARVRASLANFDEFAKAYNCPVGSQMNPKDKCILWG